MLEYKFSKYRNDATTNLSNIISFEYEKVTEILKPSNQILYQNGISYDFYVKKRKEILRSKVTSNYVHVIIKQTLLSKKRNISFEMHLKRGFNIYLLASELICSLSEWVTIQYLSWILNNNFRKDEKYSPKHVDIGFLCERNFLRGEKRVKFTANAALSLKVKCW